MNYVLIFILIQLTTHIAITQFFLLFSPHVLNIFHVTSFYLTFHSSFLKITNQFCFDLHSLTICREINIGSQCFASIINQLYVVEGSWKADSSCKQDREVASLTHQMKWRIVLLFVRGGGVEEFKQCYYLSQKQKNQSCGDPGTSIITVIIQEVQSSIPASNKVLS